MLNTQCSRGAIRILFLDHTAQLGGGELALLSLASRLDRERFEPSVILFSSGPLEAALREAGVSVQVVPLGARVRNARRGAWGRELMRASAMIPQIGGFIAKLVGVMARERPDIVHCNSLKADILGGAAARILNIPVIWHVRDRLASDYMPLHLAIGFRFLAHRIPDWLICNSHATLATLHVMPGRTQTAVVYSGMAAAAAAASIRRPDGLNETGLGPYGQALNETASLQLSLMRRSPSASLDNNDSADIKRCEAPGLIKEAAGDRLIKGEAEGSSPVSLSGAAHCGQPNVVTLVGRISPWKGQDVFIRAAAMVLKRFPDCRFQIVGSALFGEDALEGELKELAVSLGVSDRVDFLGFRKDVPEIIAGSTLLVHASTVPEPFGQVIIQAMAESKPVVATRGGGILETVEDGRTGLLVPMKDHEAMARAICEILADPVRAQKMGEAGRERFLERFTIGQTVQAVQEIYSKIGAVRSTSNGGERPGARSEGLEDAARNPESGIQKQATKNLETGIENLEEKGREALSDNLIIDRCFPARRDKLLVIKKDSFPATAGVSAVRVVYISHTAQPSGAELALLNAIANMDRRRYLPVVILLKYGPLVESLRALGIETHIIELDPSIRTAARSELLARAVLRPLVWCHAVLMILRLTRALRHLKPVVVQTNSLKSDVLGGIAARLAGMKLIWYVHDRIETDYLPAPVVKVFRFLARVIPHYVIANSQATLETLKLPKGKRSAVVYPGVAAAAAAVAAASMRRPGGLNETPGAPGLMRRPDGLNETDAAASLEDNELHKTLNEAQRNISLSEAQPNVSLSDAQRSGSLSGAAHCGQPNVVTLVGRISPWKGQDVFIRAAAMVLETFPTCRFQIVGSALFGEDALEGELKALAVSLGVGDRVEFLGFRKDVPEIIAGSTLLVHASTVPEPFGQVIIQAMAESKPVVATRGGGVLEIVDDGKTGLLVPMKDAEAMAKAICEILADPAKGQKMGEAGRARFLERFTIEKTVEEVEAVYVSMTTDH